MIEADGPDKNGGIFLLPADFSLLVCPPREKKPKIVQKFGDWDEKKENIANFPIHSAAKNNEIFLTASTEVSPCNSILHFHFENFNPNLN